MRFIIGSGSWFRGLTLALAFGCGCAHRGPAATPTESAGTKYVGTTPGDPRTLMFVGALASNAPCHSITWRIAFATTAATATEKDQSPNRSTQFHLTAHHQVPRAGNPNQSVDGPTATVTGTWEIAKGPARRPGSVVYRLHRSDSAMSLSFLKLGEDHLHLLTDPDEHLAVGNGGWSFTLYREERAEKPVSQALIASVPDLSYKILPRAKGPDVFGVFEGRSPYQGIAQQLGRPEVVGGFKAKWRVTLLQDPATSAPTTYRIEGTLFRDGAREGTWTITRGMATDPNATVYQLNTTTQPPLLLMKGDDNVVFFLDPQRRLRVGHGEFSYTLNRVPDTGVLGASTRE